MYQAKIGDQLLEISKPRVRYSKLWKEYSVFSSSLMNNFDSKYDELFSDIKLVQDVLVRWSDEYLGKASDYSVRQLIKHKIYDIDDETFIELYREKHLTWVNDISTLNDKYMELVLDDEAYRAYSEAKRNAPSGGFVGGGFGLEGAAGGIMIASAANLAVGAVTGIASAIGDGLNKLGVSQLIKNLLTSASTKRQLYLALYNLTFNTHLCVVDIINQRQKENYFEPVDKIQIRESKSIIENINKERIPVEELTAALGIAFRANPFNIDIYKHWFDIDGSLADELLKISKTFGHDLNKHIQAANVSASFESLTNPVQFEEGLVEILSSFESRDFFLFADIPAKKLENASQVYFKDRDDKVLALIDATVFGSAEIGMVFGLKGIYWATESKKACFIAWPSLAIEFDDFELTEHGIRLGSDEFSLAGSGVGKEPLFDLLSKLCNHVSSMA